MGYIYGLSSERKIRDIRYVGQTTDLSKRFMQHKTTRENTQKGIWIREENNDGHNIKMIVLGEYPDEKLYDMERFWINYYLNKGSFLTNSDLDTSIQKNSIARKYESFIFYLILFFLFMLSPIVAFTIHLVNNSDSALEIFSVSLVPLEQYLFLFSTVGIILLKITNFYKDKKCQI